MTFLAPSFLFGAIAVAAGIAGLHFIVTRQPRASVLPTARFVPDSPASAIVRDARPSDLLLMVLRVLVVLSVGAALAKPVIKPTRQAVARLFLIDVSHSLADQAEAVDSVKRLYRTGDALIVFDSSARLLRGSAAESLSTVRPVAQRGNLSAGLIASLRGASTLRDRVDSLELVIVSPFLGEEHDEATDSIRKLWRGRARLIRVAPRIDSVTAGKGNIDFHGGAGDPLAVTVALATKENGVATARLLRTATISADDSTWANSPNHVLVVWPDTGRPLFSVTTPSSVSGGISGVNARLIAAFKREWTFPSDSLRSARIVARWADGQPAVVEKEMEHRCVRSVAIPVTPIGDLVIRPEFVELMKEIAFPCGMSSPAKPLSSIAIASLSGVGPLATGSSFSAPEDVPSPLAPWLIGISLAAAVAELFLRRRP